MSYTKIEKKVTTSEALENKISRIGKKVLFFCDSTMVRRGKVVSVRSGVAIPRWNKKFDCWTIRHDSAIWELDAEHHITTFDTGEEYQDYKFTKGTYLVECK